MDWSIKIHENTKKLLASRWTHHRCDWLIQSFCKYLLGYVFTVTTYFLSLFPRSDLIDPLKYSHFNRNDDNTNNPIDCIWKLKNDGKERRKSSIDDRNIPNWFPSDCKELPGKLKIPEMNAPLVKGSSSFCTHSHIC